MVPAGAATEQVVMDLAARMEPGDTIVDGGNSFYKDDVRRMKVLRDTGLHYVDVGARGPRGPPSAGTSTAGPRAPATSSRWSTTASSTGSCRPTPRASTS